MAAAEARTAWQRTANRIFVQEDAKRAPKLPCCPTPCVSSKQVDVGPTSGLDGSAHPVIGFASVSGIPSASNLLPETRWWLQLQPNFGYQKGMTHEKLYALEGDGENTKAYILGSSPKFSEDCLQKIEDSQFVHTTVYMQKDPVVRTQELKKAQYSENAQALNEMKESYQVVDSAFRNPEELSFGSDSVWFASEKTEPWWHTTDRDELASLVAQKSVDHVENCDLPPPQKMRVRSNQFSHFGHFDHNRTVSSSLCRTHSGSISDLNIYAQSSSTLGSTHGRQQAKVGELQTSYASKSSLSSPRQDVTVSEKAKLLKALCYSQTRAREAENEAKQVKAEKEHLVELLLRQASQLFAYKQWLQILQLEAFYFHLKNNGQPILNVFPLAFPRLARKSGGSSHKAAASGKRVKQGRPKFDIAKCAVALALGFSLVGAGLLLGWTVGWMFPTL